MKRVLMALGWLAELWFVLCPCDAAVIEKEFDGVTVVCDTRVCTLERAASIVVGFSESLRACIEKERMIDLLGSDSMLWEVHELIAAYGSNEHIMDVDPALLDMIKRSYLQNRERTTQIRFNKASFLDYDDVLQALKEGQRIGGVTYNARENLIEAEFEAGSPEWREGIVLPLRGPKYDLAWVEKLLGGIVKAIDQVLDYESKVAAVRYVYAKAEAGSRTRFDFIDDRQKWFHIGYSGYVAYMVARHYIGEKEVTQLWERLYSFKSKQTIPEAAIFEWREQEYDRRALVWLAQRVFFDANKRIEFEGIAEFLRRVDDERAAISAGETTVKALLEEHLSCSMLELLQKAGTDL